MPVDIERMKAGPEWAALEPAQQVELLRRAQEMNGTAAPAPAPPTLGGMAVSGARALAGQATQGAQAAGEAVVGLGGSAVGAATGDPLGRERAVAGFRNLVGAPTEPSLGGSGSEPVDPTKSFGGKVGQVVGETAPFIAGGMAAPKAAAALARLVGLVSEGQGPALLAAVSGKNTTGRVLAREARTAVQAGVGAATAQEVAPDSKTAEVIGMLTGALGPEGARKAINWAVNKIPAGYISPMTREGAQAQVGGMLAQAIPEGSVAEQGLNRAAQTQETTGIKGSVAQATQSAGAREMERSASRQFPSLAAKAQDVQASTSEAVRNRVATMPSAVGGQVPAAQEAVGRGVAADIAATDVPVAKAEEAVLAARQQFGAVAMDVEKNLQAEVAAGEKKLADAATSIRPTLDGPELGNLIHQQIDGPEQAMKTQVDRVYALVDPDNQVVLSTDRVAGAIAQAKAEEAAALRDPIPELGRLENLLQGKGSATFNEIRGWASALGNRARALLRGANPDPGAAHILRGASEAVAKTLDDAMENPALASGPGGTVVHLGAETLDRWHEAKRLYAQYRDTFVNGAVGRVLQLAAHGPETKIAAQDVGKAFFRADSAKESVRSLQQYFNAAGDSPAARAAIRDVALEDFFETTYRQGAGTMDAAAGTRWIQAHDRQLRELAGAGVDIRPELERLVEQRQSVDQLSRNADQAKQRLLSGQVQTGPSRQFPTTPEEAGLSSPIAMAEQHLQLARNAAARSVREIEQSAASKFIGADPNQAGKALLSGLSPAKDVAAVMRAAAGDPAAQRGIRRALLDQALGEAKSPIVLATGQPLFDGPDFGGFLDRHEGALRAAFGDGGYAALKREHAIAQTVVDPTSPVTRAASLGPAEAVYTTQMVLGRAYQGAKGFVAKAYLAGEVVARTLARSMNQFTNAELRQVYEDSLFDPVVARDLRALSLRGDAPKEAIKRLRAHLGPASQRAGEVNQQPSPLPQ